MYQTQIVEDVVAYCAAICCCMRTPILQSTRAQGFGATNTLGFLDDWSYLFNDPNSDVHIMCSQGLATSQ